MEESRPRPLKARPETRRCTAGLESDRPAGMGWPKTQAAIESLSPIKQDYDLEEQNRGENEEAPERKLLDA
jgi:hypothetical protein